MSSANQMTAIFWAKAVYIGITLIPPSMYHFSVSWLNQLKDKKKLVALIYTLAWCFNILFIFTDRLVIGVQRHFFGFFSRLGDLYLLYLFFFFGVSSLFFWNLVQGYRKDTIPIKRTQIKHVLIAFILCFIVGITEYLPTFGIEFYPLGFIAILILVSVVGHAIIRYKLWEIETVIHKTIAWLLTTSVLVVPLAALLYFTKPWYVQLAPLGTASYAGGLLLFFMLFVKTFQPRVDHFFQRGRANIEDILNQFSDELVHLRGLEELVNRITDTIMNTLYASKVTILLYNDRSKKLVTVGAIRDSLKVVLQLDPEQPFLKWLSQNDRIVNREFIEIDPRYEPIRAQAEEFIRQFEAVLCIPLVLNEKLIGLINLGRKANLKSYRALDYQFLNRLKNQATIAISNSLVYDRVEELVKIRTEELVQTQKQLIQAEKLATVGTLAGGVAHEINNPLAAIMMNAQMLLGTASDEEEKESLKLIEAASQRCRDIVKKLMVYSRKPLGGREIGEVDLEKVINNILSFLGHQLAQEDIRVNVKIENRLLIVRGCQNELEQVLTNLLLNSRDAIRSFKKEGEIIISAAAGVDDKVTLEVKDDGIGISQENLSKIFDPFFTTKDVGKGTGLGLSICQSIVEQHGGTIAVKSQPGQGATFTITIPKNFNPDMSKGSHVSSSTRSVTI